MPVKQGREKFAEGRGSVMSKCFSMNERLYVYSKITKYRFLYYLGDPVALQAYLEEKEIPVKVRKGWFIPSETPVYDTADQNAITSVTSSPAAVTEPVSSSPCCNTHGAFENASQYHTINSFALISLLLETFELSKTEIELILTDDVKGAKPFEMCMKSLQENYVHFK